MSNAKVLYLQMKQFVDPQPVIQTAVREVDGLAPERAGELFDALLQWMSVIPNSEPGKPLQMLKSVDRLWHAFILNTKLYRDFCNEFFGGSIDHDPVEAANPELPRKEYGAYTLTLLECHFGEALNPALRDLTADVTCCFFKPLSCKKLGGIFSRAVPYTPATRNIEFGG